MSGFIYELAENSVVKDSLTTASGVRHGSTCSILEHVGGKVQDSVCANFAHTAADALRGKATTEDYSVVRQGVTEK